MENKGKKIYIIGDVHCRDFYKPILNITDEPVIFLGDYMDPYSWENLSNEQGIENLKEIFEYRKNNKNVILLVGNHDCSYIWSALGWERTNSKYWKELHKLYRENIDLFTAAVKIDNTIFTHAGICSGWLTIMNNLFDKNKFQLTEDNIVDYINNEFQLELKHEYAEHYSWYNHLNSPIFDVGKSRGGDSRFGGPLWSDFNHDFYPPKDWKGFQIFGHTQCEDTGWVRTIVSGACLDSRAIFEYNPETGLIIPSELNNEKTKEEICEEDWHGNRIFSFEEHERSIEEYIRNHANEDSYE